MQSQRLTIKHLAEEDRPREKLLKKGRSALTEAELIAVMLGSGNKNQTAVELAQHILNQCKNNLNILAKQSIHDLMKFNGVGEAKAISIISALEIGRRRKATGSGDSVKIESSSDAHELLKGDLLDLQHEEFWIVMLKRNHEVIKKDKISSGGVSGTLVDSKIIFKRALEETASSILLAHNHPSGNLNPSTEDIKLTKKLQDAGKHLDISVIDHIIVTDHSYLSFADENII